MLYREIIAVCSEIHIKYINTLCGQNVEFRNVKPDLLKLKSLYHGYLVQGGHKILILVLVSGHKHTAIQKYHLHLKACHSDQNQQCFLALNHGL